ncbi:MAG: hypothetical protein AAF607_12165 [Pseudomonadota bacterium]
MDLDQINKPDREHLKPAHVDHVARALISLTREVCVLTDRVAVLEQVLDDKGINVSQAIENHQPNEAQTARIKERTQRTINAVTSALYDT